MNKKEYIILGITAMFFIIVIAVISIINNKGSWINEILKADSYKITMQDCNNKIVELPKESVKEILNKIKKSSDNGPWTGDNNKCYTTIIIKYNIKEIVQQREIKIIDKSSIAVNLNDGDRYYVNAEEAINHANSLFSIYQ